jgi:hypothetical protein
MTVVEELVQIASVLGPDEQRCLLRVAVQLREGTGPDLASMPAADAGEPAWVAWRDGLRGRQEAALLVEKNRLVGLGLIDDAWAARTDALPQDMLPTSDTSVET